tara:strand:- start:1253 stop:1411 length:159 start_codon:yes stop_codon:yes gene_type:complete
MELYGSIKQQKGRFPTLNHTLYAFTAIFPFNFKDMGRYHSLNKKAIKKLFFL